MGATGAGKSSFINTVLGTDFLKVGHKIESCTTEVTAVEVPSEKLQDIPLLSNKGIYLVDTPGFDDTYKDDVEILKKISKWLKASYNEYALGGVIYLHDISVDRYTGTAKRNLQLFNKLCGESESVLDRVIIGLTKGDRIQPDEEIRRREGLKQRQFNYMMAKGVEVLRVSRGDSKSGHPNTILRNLLHKQQTRLILRIQEEMAVMKKVVSQTDAAQELRLTLAQVLKLQKQRSEVSVAPTDLEEARRQIQNLSDQLKALQIPFSRRLRMLLGF
ncbi:hypothetical protein JR316_0000041 [Psilocybe cubensis]|nr:hypothetical protein JR316_0000041 [Psilocybe cubensis]KAH9485979.1 hypothetical protein JR316_0000041 [Psilocybe cubensis]